MSEKTITDKLAEALRNVHPRLAGGTRAVANDWPEVQAAREVLAEYDAQKAQLPRFTVFCREATGEGTMYITSIAADTWQLAAQQGLECCSAARQMDPDDINVIGVAHGDVGIVAWDDDSTTGVNFEKTTP